MAADSVAWTCTTIGQPLQLLPLTLPELGDNDVRVQVLYCGLCASDVTAIKRELGMYKFPLVAGHEGIGKVTAIGKTVRSVKVGDNVGLGIYRNRCGACIDCNDGKDNSCASRQFMFMGGNSGAFGRYVHINEIFAVPIPHGYPLEYAGPLMCAGQTVFAPFLTNNIRPGDRVGVLGIGGLGHLALQFANKMGCKVTAFSRTDAKKKEAMQFGAHNFVATDDEAQAKGAVDTQDFILVTASGTPNSAWPQLFSFLASGGLIILLGFSSTQPIPVPPMELIMGQKGIRGSAGGSSGCVKKMLKFAHEHNIKPQIELMNFSQIAEAIKKVEDGSVRYRAVLKWD